MKQHSSRASELLPAYILPQRFLLQTSSRGRSFKSPSVSQSVQLLTRIQFSVIMPNSKTRNWGHNTVESQTLSSFFPLSCQLTHLEQQVSMHRPQEIMYWPLKDALLSLFWTLIHQQLEISHSPKFNRNQNCGNRK